MKNARKTLFNLLIVAPISLMGLLFIGLIIWAVVAPPAKAEWVSPRGHVFTGVEVFYGPEHEDIGTIKGATDGVVVENGKPVNDVLIHYKSDGSDDWKDRDYIENGPWSIRSDDPNFDSGNVEKYQREQ